MMHYICITFASLLKHHFRCVTRPFLKCALLMHAPNICFNLRPALEPGHNSRSAHWLITPIPTAFPPVVCLFTAHLLFPFHLELALFVWVS